MRLFFDITFLAVATCLVGVHAHAEPSRSSCSPSVGGFEGPKRHLRIHEPAHDNGEERGYLQDLEFFSSNVNKDAMAISASELQSKKHHEIKTTDAKLQLHEETDKDQLRSIVEHWKNYVNDYNSDDTNRPITLVETLKAQYEYEGLDKIIAIAIKDEDKVSTAVASASEPHPSKKPRVDTTFYPEMSKDGVIPILKFWMANVEYLNRFSSYIQTTLVQTLEAKYSDGVADKMIEILLEDETTVSQAVAHAPESQASTNRLETSHKVEASSPQISTMLKLRLKKRMDSDEIEFILRYCTTYVTKFNNENGNIQTTLPQTLRDAYGKEGANLIINLANDNEVAIPDAGTVALELQADPLTDLSTMLKLQYHEGKSKDEVEFIRDYWTTHGREIRDTSKSSRFTPSRILQRVYGVENLKKIMGIAPKIKRTKGSSAVRLMHANANPDEVLSEIFRIERSGNHHRHSAFTTWVNYVNEFNNNNPNKAKTLLQRIEVCNEKDLVDLLFDANYAAKTPTGRLVLDNLVQSWLSKNLQPADVFVRLGLRGETINFKRKRYIEWMDYLHKFNVKNKEKKVTVISELLLLYAPDDLQKIFEAEKQRKLQKSLVNHLMQV